MPYQFMSISHQRRPCRAECMCAWWLLCQPSPKVRIATQKLLRESSSVSKRREPHKVGRRVHQPGEVQSERDAQEDRPQGHLPAEHAPRISRPDTVSGTQCHLLIQTWKRSCTRSRA